MRDTFLIGRFLPGHTTSFGRRRLPAAEGRAFAPDDLQQRMGARNARGRGREARHRIVLMSTTAAALLLLIAGSYIPLRGTSTFEVSVAPQEVMTMEDIAQTRQQLQAPPPPRPPVPVAVADDVVLEDETLDLDATLELDVALDLPSAPPPPVQTASHEEEDEPEIFTVVEVMPQMVGGMASLAAALQYPEAARRAGIEGTVIVRIVIDEEGTPSRPTVLRSPGKVLEDAAVEAVMQQRYIPGRQRNRVVSVQMAIPVRFQLTTS